MELFDMRLARIFILICTLALVARGVAPTSAPTLEAVNLFAMGDWGMNNIFQKEVASAMADYAGKIDGQLDGVLLAGDNFYVNLTGVDDPLWQQMFEQMYDSKKLNAPFYAALGNHDYQKGRINIEFEYARRNPHSRWKLPANWYRVDFPQNAPLVTVLMLNSNKDQLTAQQWQAELQWMERELSEPRAKWLVCVAHHPLFSNGSHGDNGVLQTQWGPLFQKHNVDFYVCGHDHDLQHLEMPGFRTSFVMCGGGGGNVRAMRRDNRGPFSVPAYGFTHLRFSLQGVRVNYVDRSASIVHFFEKDAQGNLVPGEATKTESANVKTVPRD
jgi:tartrate-resistant acid phosphatase type 5